MLRFVQITDTHVGPTPEFELYARKPFEHLRRLVETINALPFPIDFVLHTGDVVNDRTAAEYALARTALSRLTVPVRYVAGNHDDATELQRGLMNVTAPPDKLVYDFDAGGYRFVVLDTRGPTDPGGWVDDKQLAAVRALGDEPDGPPVIIAMHHHAVSLDSPWLDFRGSNWPEEKRMCLVNRAAFLEALDAAGRRVKAVFCGHVHNPFTVVRNGVTFVAGPSAFRQLRSWPTDDIVVPDDAMAGGFNVVTVTEEQVLVRYRSLA